MTPIQSLNGATNQLCLQQHTKSNQKEYQNTCTFNQILDTKKQQQNFDHHTGVTSINLNHIFYINESTELENLE